MSGEEEQQMKCSFDGWKSREAEMLISILERGGGGEGGSGG